VGYHCSRGTFCLHYQSRKLRQQQNFDYNHCEYLKAVSPEVYRFSNVQLVYVLSLRTPILSDESIISESTVMISDGFSIYEVRHETTVIQFYLRFISVMFLDKYNSSFIALLYIVIIIDFFNCHNRCSLF
jgi:hypothetical protein